MNVGFHLCIHDWCFQKGTKEQYTRCKKASEDGRTCYYPTIRYGSTIGGNPYKHGNNNILNWCLQLFPTSIKGIATYNNHNSWYSKPNYSTTAGALFWCNGYDENNYHWCDWQDGKWKDSTLDFQGSLYLMDSVTCQIP